MRTWKRIIGAILVFVLFFVMLPTPVFADRVSDIRQELSNISNELTQISQELSSITARASELSREVSQLTASISVPGADLQAISNRLSQIQAEANQLSARKIVLDERKGYLASRVASLQQEVDALTRQAAPPVAGPSPSATPPPVVNPPTPVVNPPIITSPVQIGARITGTLVPNPIRVNERAEFRAYFEGVAPEGYAAAATIRKIGGHEEDWQRIVLGHESGYAWWKPFFYEAGDYQVIFGIWRGDSPVTRSDWISFRVEGANSPPVITTPSPAVNQVVSGEITNTILPNYISVGDRVEFRMDIRNNGNTSWNFLGALTARPPSGPDIDFGKVSLFLNPGETKSVSWSHIFDYAGDYRFIFGIWKDDQTPLARSGWMVIGVSAESSSISDPDSAIAPYNDMDGAAEYVPNTLVDEDWDKEGESWEEIQNKSYRVPFRNRYVYLSPKTHFLFEHRPAVSPNEVLVTNKTIGLTVSVDGVDYYPIDLISSLGGSVRYEGNFIAVRLGENEALLDLDNQTVIANGDLYPIDPIWHHGDIAITADSVNLPTGFYLGFFGIHPARMSIYQEDTAYAEEFGNAHDEGPAFIRDWVIGSVSGYFVGKAATILVSRAVSTIATRIVVSGISREAAVIATVEAERTAVSGMIKVVLSRLPKATSYEISLATERRLLARAAKVTGEKAGRGILGEVNLVRAFRKLGVEIHPDFNHLYHGFDNVGRLGERIVIGEAKYVSKVGQFTLSDLPETSFGRQMDSDWIEYASGLLKNAGKTDLSKDIMSQLKAGSLKKVLVVTRPSGKAYGVSDDIFTLFDEVLEVDLSGSEIARYVR